MRRTPLLCVPLAALLAGCIQVNTRSEYRDVPIDDLAQWSQSPLARRGIVFLSGDLNQIAAASVCARLLTLDAMPEVERVTLLVNSSFGSPYAARSVVNCMRSLAKPVDVVNTGHCWNGACLIHQSATGRRLAQPDTVFAFARTARTSDEREVQAWLQQEDLRFAETLRARSALPAEWFPLTTTVRIFDADEALRLKFIDAVQEPRRP